VTSNAPGSARNKRSVFSNTMQIVALSLSHWQTWAA
jgi:hypothetical protein